MSVILKSIEYYWLHVEQAHLQYIAVAIDIKELTRVKLFVGTLTVHVILQRGFWAINVCTRVCY